jgi:hypothetical protein
MGLEKLMALRNFSDNKLQSSKNEKQMTDEEIKDFKICLQIQDLVSIIGQESVEELERTFAGKYDEIVIRRCESHGQFINFHTDVALKTMQVALNDDYKGGKLLFLSDGGRVVQPERKSGTVTIHHNDILHGVTVLESGTRYGLFLLRKN